MSRFQMIGFDADDTLWQNERLYVEAQARFRTLLAEFHSPEWIDERLFATEMRNLQHFGYGIKAFALSMIETAIELTEGRISSAEIQTLIDLSKEMLAADVDLLEEVADTVSALAGERSLMVITKGDLRDQESKMARSGLASHFQHVEIVSDKSAESYERLLRRHGIAPEHFLMVGNSLRSDILPILAIGGSAVYVPHSLTWAHEAATPPSSDHPGYYEIAHIGLLPTLLTRLEKHG
ncbi:MAG: HAD family hydrolase [Armatimonadota bacterium]